MSSAAGASREGRTPEAWRRVAGGKRRMACRHRFRSCPHVHPGRGAGGRPSAVPPPSRRGCAGPRLLDVEAGGGDALRVPPKVLFHPCGELFPLSRRMSERFGRPRTRDPRDSESRSRRPTARGPACGVRSLHRGSAVALGQTLVDLSVLREDVSRRRFELLVARELLFQAHAHQLIERHALFLRRVLDPARHVIGDVNLQRLIR